MNPKKTAPAPAPAEAAREVSQRTGKSAPSVRQGCLQIDGFGLPVNGPARAKVLAELKDAKGDPLANPKDWNETLAGEARKLTEKFYG